MMEERQWTPEELQALAELGLAITPHSDASYGWGYIWQGRDWVGPCTTIDAAIHAAFTEALQALKFRSKYSWVQFAQPGERWQFNADGEGWVRIDAPPRKGHSRDIERSNVEEQARQDWSNDE